MVGPNGNWKWESFEHLLPTNILLHIAATKALIIGSEPDVIRWNGSHDLSVAVVGVVHKDYNGYHNFCGHFAKLWRRPWHVKVVLVKRQGNQVADACAKLANCNTLDIIHFDRPPASVSHLLQLDLSADR
ncbi:hypothetical protein V6N13_064767 [Hibiscus sabdariffa]